MERVDESFQLPPGNWMARKLRLVNDNSLTLFPPKTSNSRKSYKKYDTIYNREYKNSPNYDAKDRQQPFERKRETVQDVLFSGNFDPAQMFSQWKIPARILESPPRERSSLALSRQSLQDPEKIIRQSTLPEITLNNSIQQFRPSTQGGIKPRRPESRALGVPASNSARFFREKPSSQVWKEEDEKKQKVKKKIAHVLRTDDDQKHIMVNKVRKTLDPEERKAVDKWLESASDADRRMALKLFAAVDNNNLPDTEKQLRIEGILKLVERRSTSHVYESDNLSERMKHLRLQNDDTRNKRWMLATWHHLPEYLDWDPVNNVSSMYTKPHQPIPHDYVIHPDWG